MATRFKLTSISPPEDGHGQQLGRAWAGVAGVGEQRTESTGVQPGGLGRAWWLVVLQSISGNETGPWRWMEPGTRPGGGGARVCVRLNRNGWRPGSPAVAVVGRGGGEKQEGHAGGKGEGRRRVVLWAGGCQPEGRRGLGWAGGPGQGEGAWGSWRVVRAGRQASVPEAYFSVCPQRGWCAVSPVLSVSSSDSRPSGEHPWEETFWVPDLRTGRVACGVVASHQLPEPFLASGLIFRHLCPRFSPDSFTSCLVLTPPL